MSSSSSVSSASQQASSSVQQLLKKSASQTPQQANNQTLTNARNASDKPPTQDPLNTSGSRGIKVNVSA